MADRSWVPLVKTPESPSEKLFSNMSSQIMPGAYQAKAVAKVLRATQTGLKNYNEKRRIQSQVKE